jgi:3-oxosteroid 1-dehydrogenase
VAGDIASRTDLVVVGSGASGLMAALSASRNGASVVLLEKSKLFGGSSSLSGGQLWIPVNRLAKEAGIKDSHSAAENYLRRLTLGRVNPLLISAFVRNASTAFEFLVEETGMKPELREGLPDYHPEWEGSLKGGRTIDPGIFEGDKLGSMYRMIRHNPHYHLPGGIHTTSREFEMIMRGEEVPGLKSRKPSVLALGEALVGNLMNAVLRRGVKVHLGTSVTGLLFEDGSVSGVRYSTKRGEGVIYSRCGVILAAGGFDWNQKMKKRYLLGPSENCAGSPDNTGDGIIIGANVGGALALMEEAWWFTLLLEPGEVRGRLVTSERTLPGSIMVNRYGRRFANEAMNYSDLTRVMLQFDPSTYEHTNIPAYLILDSGHRRKYWLGSLPPGSKLPKWIVSAPTLRELSKKLGVDSAALERTVKRFNSNARRGRDPDFGRGDSMYDSHWGDPDADHPTLGPVSEPPFYGVRILAGDLGTKGGLVTDKSGRVLDLKGRAIRGLYAVGNNAASIMGPGYAGSGATLGPCITFGYLAGVSAAARRN